MLVRSGALVYPLAMTEYDQGSGAGVPPYTRTGDDGKTTLGDLSRVAKSDSRVEAYAACEEANAALGAVVAAAGALAADVVTVLSRVQNDLVEVQGDLGTPVPDDNDPQRRIDDDYIQRVEEACDHFNNQLPLISTVVLPGGTESGAQLYQAGTIARRAERETWRACDEHKNVNRKVGPYLNRLADLLFVLGRLSNTEHGDAIWRPGLTEDAGSLLPPEPEASEEAG